LSSAKSLGRKSVTRFPMMWPSWISEMAVLPELASTTSSLVLRLSAKNCFTALSLLLPKGFRYSSLACLTHCLRISGNPLPSTKLEDRSGEYCLWYPRSLSFWFAYDVCMPKLQQQPYPQ
jgi:hypothetical protein